MEIDQILESDDFNALQIAMNNEDKFKYKGEEIMKDQIVCFAAEKNATNCLTYLIMDGVQNSNIYYSLASYAAKYGSIQALEILQNNRISLENGFKSALEYGNYDSLMFLYVNAFDEIKDLLSDPNSMILACKGGNIDCVNFILSLDDSLINYVNGQNDYPLKTAIENENTDASLALLANKQLKIDVTQLHELITLAIKHKQKETLFILTHHVLFNDIPNHFSFIEEAFETKDSDILSILLKSTNLSNDEKVKTFFLSLEKQTNPLSLYFIDNKFPINILDEYHQTPLHIAAAQGNEVVVKALLKRPEIKVDILDIKKKTALQRAIEASQTKVASLLLKYNKKQVNRKTTRK